MQFLCAIASSTYFKTEEVVTKSDEEFPYPLFELNGRFALAKWTELSLEPGTPVIIGSLEEFNNIRDTFEFSADQSVKDALDKAAKLTHPTSLFDHIDAERAGTKLTPLT